MTTTHRFLFALIISVAFGSSTFYAQDPFERIYNTSQDRVFRDVLRTPDGGYILCGYTNVTDPSECDVMINRADRFGNELPGWPKFHGETGPSKVDFAYSMIEDSDGNYIIVGYSSSYGGGDVDMYVLKIDPNGTKLARASFGGSKWDEARKIIKTNDGNYVIAGSTTLSDNNQQACLIKIDKNLNPIWSPAIKMFGGGSREFGNSVQEAFDGGLILVGQSFASDSRGDTYLVKVKSNADPDWEKVYGQPLGDEAVGLVINSDNTFVVAIRDSITGKDIDVRVRRFNADGTAPSGPNDNKSFGGNQKDTPKTISKAKDGNYYIGAISRSWNWRGNSVFDSPDMWLLKINSGTLDTIWSRNFGRSDHDHCEQAIADPVDNAILLCGHSVQQPYVKKSYFLKINEAGVIGPLAINKNDFYANTSVYPNPTSGMLAIEASSDTKLTALVVTNYLGQPVYTNKEISKGDGASATIDLRGHAPGVYLLNIEGEHGKITRKIILE